MNIRKLLAVLALTIIGYSFGQTENEEKEIGHYLYDHDTIIKDTDENIYKVENLGEKVNSMHVESGPRISPDGNTLYFFRIDHPENTNHSRDIWYSEYNKEDSTWGEAKHQEWPLNSVGDNSVHSISADGQKILLHNVYLKNGLTKNGVSYSEKLSDGKWAFPKELKIRHYKNDEVCSFHMNDDWTILILAIHGKKSKGHQDLYVSFLEDDGEHYTEPLNLGEVVNTSESEATAFLAADHKTLYFSSNGRADKIGGFDIYKTERLDSTWTNWSEPKNMGIPFNTPDNEFYFSTPTNSEYAYLSHHFKGGDKEEHSDIVRIKLLEEAKPKILVLKGIVVDADTKEKIESHYIIKEAPANKEVANGYSDTTNGFENTLALGKKYYVIADAKNYKTDSVMIDATQLTKYYEKKITIELEKEPLLTLTGFFINAKDSTTKIPGTLTVERLPKGSNTINTKASPERGYKTILDGGYEYRLTASSDGYLESFADINLKDLKGWEDSTLNFYLQPIEKESFEIEGIFFDYNSHKLQARSFPVLDNVVDILKRHPEIKVELSAHTDSRGSDKYNESLSQRRAQSTVDYLIKKGIPKSALVAKGYGEQKITNECTNGVKCSDAKHEENRRVEFEILDIKE